MTNIIEAPAYAPEEIQVHRKLWTDALRSGEYEQTMGRLQWTEGARDEQLRMDEEVGYTDPDLGPVGYCCLGVACEVAIKAGVIETFDPEGAFLPDEVANWLGITPEGRTSIPDKSGYLQALYDLNDGHKLNFEELADIIDEPSNLIAPDEIENVERRTSYGYPTFKVVD